MQGYQLTTCRYLLQRDLTNISEAVWVFRLGSNSAQNVLIRTWNGHSVSHMRPLFFSGGKISVIWTPVCICSKHCTVSFFFSQLFFKHSYRVTGFSKHLQILLMYFKRCVEGMNGMTGIWVSLTLYHLLPLKNYREILGKNLHPEWNGKA